MPKTFRFLKDSLAIICHKFKGNNYNHPVSNEANETQLVPGRGIVWWWWELHACENIYKCWSMGSGSCTAYLSWLCWQRQNNSQACWPPAPPTALKIERQVSMALKWGNLGSPRFLSRDVLSLFTECYCFLDSKANRKLSWQPHVSDFRALFKAPQL